MITEDKQKAINDLRELRSKLRETKDPKERRAIQNKILEVMKQYDVYDEYGD